MSSMGGPVSLRPFEMKKNITSPQIIPQEKEETKHDFVCKCPDGFTGPTCEISKFLKEEQQ